MKRKKPAPEPPQIEGDFAVLGCDLSMHRPGFALIMYHADTRTCE